MGVIQAIVIESGKIIKVSVNLSSTQINNSIVARDRNAKIITGWTKSAECGIN